MKEWSSGKGSWYSQFSGKYEWVDTGDKPNSNKLGVPDNQQGIALPNEETLGKYFDVRAPNGTLLRLPHTDLGPHPRTGRTIDIAAVAAEAFGYTPANFPTDSIFYWTPAPENEEPIDDSPTTIEEPPKPEPPRPPVIAPPPTPDTIDAGFAQVRAHLAATANAVNKLEQSVRTATPTGDRIADAFRRMADEFQKISPVLTVEPAPTTRKASPIMNNEQLKSIVRSVLIALGGLVTGWAASKGWDISGLSSIVSVETLAGLVVAVATAWWGAASKTAPNLIVSAANAVPELTAVTLDDPRLAKAVEAKNPDAAIEIRR